MQVYELPQSLFSRAASLFDEAWADGAFIQSAFERTVAARVFVDDAEQPTAALMCRTFEYYVAGSTEAVALRRFMRDAPEEVHGDFYGYVATNVLLSRAITADHAGRLVTVARRGYRWQGDDAAFAALERWRTPQPGGVVIRRFDRALAERTDRELGTMTAAFWGGHDRFLAHGFGFCTLVGDALAGICYTCGAGGGEANIAVVTAPEFRRQGHAARACVAFIDHCRANGLTATWDTDSNNQPSARLADALGFWEDHPFSQLSTPGYRPLDLSRGRWRPGESDADGVIAWQSAEGG